MLLMMARVRPCSARWCLASLARSMVTSLPSVFTVMPSLRPNVSSPLGPFTCTLLPSVFSSTFAGISIGNFPILDMVLNLLLQHAKSINITQHFAAYFHLAGFLVGHDALAGGEDGDAKPV